MLNSQVFKSYIPDEVKLINRILFAGHQLQLHGVIFDPPDSIIDFLDKQIIRRAGIAIFLYCHPLQPLNCQSSKISEILPVFDQTLHQLYFQDIKTFWEKEGIRIEQYHLHTSHYDKITERIQLPLLEFPLALRHPVSHKDQPVTLQIIFFPNKYLCTATYDIFVTQILNEDYENLFLNQLPEKILKSIYGE
ncbi:MAG: hypothetical protein WCJ58_04890 [bacterium]